MTRGQVKRRLALAWWQYLAVGLVPLPVMAWAFGGGQALIPVLAMPLFIAGAATLFLSLPRFGAYKRALIGTSKVLDTPEEPAAWIELARVRRLAMTYACFPAWIAALSVLVGLEAVPQVLLALSTVMLLYLYRIPRQLG
ncbi:nuclear fragile X mental retardation-interacting protein 1 [uncultured Pseudomonas sp.]|uniref:nuclear fragile X mental retardation-interacting protein 1 n=1 Tax=Pseudomonas TaxID=286 RepID=UPI0016449AEB|nr:nuclear fragile X mental retardation-interacting protein 1 [uncultured Pseudomonas sp.]MBC3421020.1 nuclear fragile X mental retardation-interacting protein 1 [Pseudomonas sp. RW3S2]MBC3467302.1 nuclear fragile X mental retardation-interacting protein 1 [Pseudomonas sp. RW10S2]QXI43123.1 nuclear fragile X mental retardation-interacting protein 1 [Pseudomonas wayambapalatensis]